jgi:hypothetical protein
MKKEKKIKTNNEIIINLKPFYLSMNCIILKELDKTLNGAK